MEFSRQEYQSGLPFPPPGDLPDPGIRHTSLMPPALQVDSLLLSHLGNPRQWVSPGVKRAERGGILSRVEGSSHHQYQLPGASTGNNANNGRAVDTSSVPAIALNALKPYN